MILTAEQYWMVADVYEKVAADKLGVPPRQRAAFARKATRFRMLARLAAKIEATAVIKQARPLKPRQNDCFARTERLQFGVEAKAKYQTIEERLKTARVRCAEASVLQRS